MTLIREKILVTGGAGFIGSHSVDLLLANGFQVRVLDNLSSGTPENLPSDHPNLELVVGDVTHERDVDAAMHGIDRCLHLAAQVSVDRSIKDPLHSCQQNILGHLCVINAAVKNELKRFVYASSAAIYGNPETLPIQEASTPLAPISPYGLEKQVNEQYAALFQQLHGLSSLGLRYFNVYGPRQDPSSHYAGVISIFVSRMQQGKSVTIFGDGKQSRDFVFVHDVAKANMAALFAQGASGVCNVATGNSITLLQMIEVLASFSGDSHIKFSPARSGDIYQSAADVGLMQTLLNMRADTLPETGLKELWNASKHTQ
ncbi:MAG: NAD-dependent epimerase/dehydratase family protein [Mariprofundaceae bacterium]